MILHHDHAFAEDALFTYKVYLTYISLYNAATAQAELKFITAPFETATYSTLWQGETACKTRAHCLGG
jgi:hypothetical protein